MEKLRYHHIGIPTNKPLPKEDYSPEHKMTVSGYYKNPYGIEWMNFDSDCPLPALVKTVPHVAFVVDNIEAEIAGKNVIIEPNSSAEGVTIAFIAVDGAPVEFIQFDRPETEIWSHGAQFKI
jgi:hypothetical protein